MGGCRCSYKTCRSATKTAEGLHFFHYPVKHRERCLSWIKNAEKHDFLSLPDDQLRNKVICGLHFAEKYFTNVQHKRLVHDAIPTLNGGCREEVLIKDVEIYPTSVDGSTFSMQTDHLQAGTSRSTSSVDLVKEVKFSFRAQSPVAFEPIESEVYTIDPSYIRESFQNPDSNGKDIFLHSNNYQNQEDANYLVVDKIETEEYILPTNHNQLYDHEEYLIPNDIDHEKVMYYEPPNYEMANKIKTSDSGDEDKMDDDNAGEDEEEVEEVVLVEDEEEMPLIDLPPIIHEEPLKLPTNRPNKKILKRIQVHTQKIANIKKSLIKSNRGISKKNILSCLHGKIPPTLFGALSLHLNRKECNFTNDERCFMSSLFSISPNAYNTFKSTYGWYLPDEKTVKNITHKNS